MSSIHSPSAGESQRSLWDWFGDGCLNETLARCSEHESRDRSTPDPSVKEQKLSEVDPRTQPGEAFPPGYEQMGKIYPRG